MGREAWQATVHRVTESDTTEARRNIQFTILTILKQTFQRLLLHVQLLLLFGPKALSPAPQGNCTYWWLLPSPPSALPLATTDVLCLNGFAHFHCTLMHDELGKTISGK